MAITTQSEGELRIMKAEEALNEMYNSTRGLKLSAVEHEQLKLVAQSIINRIAKEKKEIQPDLKED